MVGGRSQVTEERLCECDRDYKDISQCVFVSQPTAAQQLEVKMMSFKRHLWLTERETGLSINPMNMATGEPYNNTIDRK